MPVLSITHAGFGGSMSALYLIFSTLLGLLAVGGAQKDDRYDLVILGGRVIDGTGASIHAADIAIQGDKIVQVGYLEKDGRRTIDARGYWIAPGFIDMHSHSEFSLLEDGRGLSALYQGVTLTVLGEHTSPGPMTGPAEPSQSLYNPAGLTQDWKTLGEYFDRLEKGRIALNVGSFVSSGQVRACVLGYENRPVSALEMSQMKKLVAQAMDEGALGLSSGLAYVPNAYAGPGELMELARVAASKGGIYSTHLRTGAADPMAGLNECLRIAEAAKIPVEIDHISSAAGTRIEWYGEVINAARKRGLNIEANLCPYTADISFLRALLPEWAQEGGTAKMLERLQNPFERQRMALDMRAGNSFNALIPWDQKMVSSRNPALDGKSLADLALGRSAIPEDVLMDILREEKGEGLVISQIVSEPFLVRAMKFPWVNIGSDGVAISAETRGYGRPHPAYFGTFPRLVGRYARGMGVISVEEMIRRMTSQPAKLLGLKDRGKVAPGMVADLVIFHPERFIDKATFENPAQYAEGVQWLLVNGIPVIDDGKYTGALPGKVVRGPAYRQRHTTAK
jgi:N-acyl-D-amino-acid deacylase